MISAWDFEDFEYTAEFRAKWQPALDEIEAELMRGLEFAVREKPSGGDWLPRDYGSLWIPVRPHIMELDRKWSEACREYAADWLKAKLRSLKLKRSSPTPRPNFTEWDQQDALSRAMAVPGPHDIPAAQRLRIGA